MDKTAFLELIQLARKNAATENNIKHAWQKSGLFPIQPKVVLDRLGLKEPESELITPSSITITASNADSVWIPFTPTTTKQVDQLVGQIKAGNHDPALPEKLAKACNSALASSILLKNTNNDLIKAQQRTKNKAKRTKGHWTEARVLNQDVIEERNVNQTIKTFEQEWRTLSHLGPAVFEERKRGRSRKKDKKETIVPATPGPLIPEWINPPQTPRRLPSQASSQRRQRGGRGGRGGRKKKEVIEEEVVVVVEEEEEAVKEDAKKSRSGRLLKAKLPYMNPYL